MESTLSKLTAEQIVEQLQNLSQQDLVLPVLVQLLVIVVVAPLAAQLVKKLGQPPAVGWIIAGIVLGPSVLGNYLPQISRLVFHLEEFGGAPAVTPLVLPPVFSMLAELALVLLLFIIGVEIRFSHLRTQRRAAMVISIAGMVAPFILGLAIAPVIQAETMPSVDPWIFSVAMATCMSITALPILGKLAIELGISQTRIAATTIASGANDDAGGWILLAAVTAWARSHFEFFPLLRMIVFSLLFAGVMFWRVRPWLSRLLQRHLDTNQGQLGRNALAYLLAYVLLCSIITQWIGIFALFGAFMAGAILSGVPGLREAVKAKLQDVVDTLLLPVFFTRTGLDTNLNALDSPKMWALFGLILLAAIAGKLGACSVAARVGGFTWRESLCIGTMMNCRALMELIAINVFAQLGVLPESVYTMLVFMALVTTVLTTPMLLWLGKGTELEEPMSHSDLGRRKTRVEEQPEPCCVNS